MMIAYLGRRLARTRDGRITVRYLSKAEGDAVWKRGVLLSIDPQGACFATQEEADQIAECLPWGSIGAIRVIPGGCDDDKCEEAPQG
jgi:hypothetical protein